MQSGSVAVSTWSTVEAGLSSSVQANGVRRISYQSRQYIASRLFIHSHIDQPLYPMHDILER